MSQDKILLIGVGNTLRSDDGIGPYVVRNIEKLQLDNVYTIAVQQLQLDILEALLKYNRVLIVDASVKIEEITILPVIANSEAITSSHHMNAASLKQMLNILYQHPVEIYTCEIPVSNFNLSDSLSEEGFAKATLAISKIVEWLA